VCQLGFDLEVRDEMSRHDAAEAPADTPSGGRRDGPAETGPETGAAEPAAAPATDAAVATDADPLLARLNERGFRLVMLADALAIYGILVGTMFWRFGLQWPSHPVPVYLVSFGVATVVYLAALYFGGLYEREPRLGAPPALPRAARQTLAGGGLLALLILGLTGLGNLTGLTTERALAIPFVNQVVLIVLGAVAVSVNRALVQHVRTRREGPPKIVLVGAADELEVARGHLVHDPTRAEVVAELEDPRGVLDAVTSSGATDVVLLSRLWLDPLYPSSIEALERAGTTVLLRVTARETMFGLERIREVGGMPFVLLRSQTVPVSRARFKRFFDLVTVSLAAPVWLPVLGAVALYQVGVAGRPVLFWQERVGARGRRFRMVKFRTMVAEAESDGHGARLAAADDPRVIPACRWIRATRLDELPQLFNVLRGEMSLVGPRPERPELTSGFEQQIPGYARRHELPPGLTGLAQIHGRYHTDAEYKLGYDLQYLVNWSPVLDISILVRTIWVVLARRV
jgi:exopolysaccharide biosynthesis polyprenyl glycosylphosphotransferase